MANGISSLVWLPGHIRLRAGFTLIELLVVISIIAVLASLLIPSVAMVKSASRKSVCANNMRQLGAGVLAYSNDNDGLMAFAYATISGLPWSGGPLFSYIQDSYDAAGPVPDSWYQGKGVLGCPEHPSEPLAAPLTTRFYSYLMNQSLVGHNPSAIPTSIGRIRRPSAKIIMVESAVGNMCEYGTPGWMNVDVRGYLWHRKTMNALYVDGHVESRGSFVWTEMAIQ